VVKVREAEHANFHHALLMVLTVGKEGINAVACGASLGDDFGDCVDVQPSGPQEIVVADEFAPEPGIDLRRPSAIRLKMT
jgi:hypothetical protein